MRIFALMIASLSFSAFGSEGAPVFYRASLPIESTVKLGKAARILTPSIAGAWQIATASFAYLTTDSLATAGGMLLQGSLGMPNTVAGAQAAELKILTYLREQSALKPLIDLEGLDEIFLVQSRIDDGKFFTASVKNRAFVFLKMKPHSPPPKLPAQFGEAVMIRSPLHDRLVLRLKIGEIEHAAQWEMSLQDFFDRQKLKPGTVGEWRASVRSEARNAAIVTEPGFSPQDVRWLDETLSLKKVPLTVEAYYLDAAGVETRLGILAEGASARKLLGITPKGWAKRGFLSLLKKPEGARLPSRRISSKSAWFCWQDRLSEIMRARAAVGIPSD